MRVLGAALGVERWVPGEAFAEEACELHQIGTGGDPIMQVGDGYGSGGVNEGVGAFDDHVASGVDVNEGRVVGERVEEPNDDGDVVGMVLEGHGDSAIGLEESDGAAIVVGEGSGFRGEGGEFGDEGYKLVADEPFEVLRVG